MVETVLPLQEARVQSLASELRSLIPVVWPNTYILKELLDLSGSCDIWVIGIIVFQLSLYVQKLLIFIKLG